MKRSGTVQSLAVSTLAQVAVREPGPSRSSWAKPSPRSWRAAASARMAGPVLERVEALARDGAVAGAPGDAHLDGHATALPAADDQRAVGGVAAHLGEHDHVGQHGRRRAGEDAAREVERPAALVVLLGGRDVAAHHHAAQGALAPQLDEDARGDDLGGHAAELVGRAAAEDQVLPLVVGGQPAQLAPQEGAVEPRLVHQPVEGVQAAGALAPALAQRVHGVGVAVEVDDALVVARHAVVGVLEHPVEVAEGVEADVVLVQHPAGLEQRGAQVAQARALVVAGAAQRVAAGPGAAGCLGGRRGAVHVVGGDADGLAQDGGRQRQVARRRRRDARVERAAHFDRSARRRARSGVLATASSAMMTYILYWAWRATSTACFLMTPCETSAPMSAGSGCM